MFPEDDNGDALRRLQANGDDLSRPRDVHFTVVFADETSAGIFAALFRDAEYQVEVEYAQVKASHPWDVVITRSLIPTHAAVSAFEAELQTAASDLGGLNDGWGCITQTGPAQ